MAAIRQWLVIRCNPDESIYYYFYFPGENEGGGGDDNGGEGGNTGESNVRRKAYSSKFPLPVARTFPDGTLPYTYADPIDAATGAFLWSYPDLKIGGKHQMNFTRFYNSMGGGIVSSMGENWNHAYEYVL